MYSTATFPPFKVTDGAWGPCMLTLSESTGLSILAKDDTSQVVLENWPWREVSHVTIKSLKKRIFQVKKYTGVKKCIKLSKRVDIERFEQTLKNSVGVKDSRNVLFQRKFTLIQPKVANSSPTYLQANPPMWNGVQTAGTVRASNENGSTPPPPPPPPPPMPSMMAPTMKPNVKQDTPKSNDSSLSGSLLHEMKAKFGNLNTEESEINLQPSKVRAMLDNSWNPTKTSLND